MRIAPILFLSLFLPLSSIFAQEEEPEALHVRADPPEFFTWRMFFEEADTVYRLGSGYYKFWVNRQLAIGPMLEKDPKFAEMLLHLLPDQGMLLKRESERLGNEIRISIKVRDMGGISPQEQHSRFLELTRQEVRLVQKAHEELHDAIFSSKTPQREAIWARIGEFVHTDIKNSTGISGYDSPEDRDYWQVIYEFQEAVKR